MPDKNQDRYAVRRCPECNRVFDLLDENDADEWYYGHDCEVVPYHELPGYKEGS